MIIIIFLLCYFSLCAFSLCANWIKIFPVIYDSVTKVGGPAWKRCITAQEMALDPLIFILTTVVLYLPFERKRYVLRQFFIPVFQHLFCYVGSSAKFVHILSWKFSRVKFCMQRQLINKKWTCCLQIWKEKPSEDLRSSYYLKSNARSTDASSSIRKDLGQSSLQ